MLMNVNSALYMLPNLLSSQKQQERLLPTWRHYKAYTSAMASSMKAWVLLLHERWAAGEEAWRDTRLPAGFSAAVQRLGSGAAASMPEGRQQWVVKLLDELNERIVGVVLSSVYDVGGKAAVEGGREDVVGNLAEAEASGQKPSSSAIQLVLLMLVTRGVVAAGELLLGTQGGGAEGTTSSKGVRGKGKVKAMSRSSNSISGNSTSGRGSHDSGTLEDKDKGSSSQEGGSSKGSSSSKGGGSSKGSSSQEGGSSKGSSSKGGGSSKGSSSTGGALSGQPLADPGERAALLKAALMMRHTFAVWHASQIKALEGVAVLPGMGSE